MNVELHHNPPVLIQSDNELVIFYIFAHSLWLCLGNTG